MNKLIRSEQEIFSDILNAIDTDGSTISEILFKTYFSYQPLKKYLVFLVQLQLVVYSKEEKRFRITRQLIYSLDIYILTRTTEECNRGRPTYLTFA